MSEPTEAMIAAAWSRDQEPMAQLLTLRSDADPEPILATDWPDGIAAGGVFYPHYPFRLTWAGASRDAPFGEGKLMIANVDRRIEEACDAALTLPELDIELVRVSAPEHAEKAIVGARVPSVDGDSSQVTAIIRPREFSQEPACAAKATPSRTPGLH